MRFLAGAPALLFLRNVPRPQSTRWRRIVARAGRSETCPTEYPIVWRASLALCGLAAFWLLAGTPVPGQTTKITSQASPDPASASTKEKLTYAVEWRLIRAATIVVEKQPHQTSLRLDSVGFVSSLFKIQDIYTVNYEDSLCATSSVMDAMEGERHHETRVTFDRTHNHATFLERDLIQNIVVKETGTDIPSCVADTLGAFAKLRTMNLGIGQSVQVPVSDGRRSAPVKATALERETIKTAAGTYKTIRYAADVLNGVIYSRKGEVFLWLTDDERRLPVQIRLRTNFPISTVTLSLEKEEHL